MGSTLIPIADYGNPPGADHLRIGVTQDSGRAVSAPRCHHVLLVAVYRAPVWVERSAFRAMLRNLASGKNHTMIDDPLERLRRLCVALPETTERLSHESPTWFVRGKKTFATYEGHRHDDRLAFWCAAPFGAQDVLCGAEPERFFVPPYVGHRGWLGVWLHVPVDWEEISGLIIDAYRVVAPKRLVALILP